MVDRAEANAPTGSDCLSHTSVNRMTIKPALVFTLFCCSLLQSLFAADISDRIRFGLSKISPAPFSETQEIEFSNCEKELEVGSFDPQAQVLLQAAERFTKEIFSLNHLKFVRATTSRDEGDVLRAEWKIEEHFTE